MQNAPYIIHHPNHGGTEIWANNTPENTKLVKALNQSVEDADPDLMCDGRDIPAYEAAVERAKAELVGVAQVYVRKNF